MLSKHVGQALLETGQMLQRVGLRAAGNLVVPAEPYTWIGKERPNVVAGVDTKPSTTVIGKDSQVGPWCKLGENVVVRSESTFPVRMGFSVEVGDNTVICSGRKSVNGLPPTVEIGSDAKIGSNCVIETSWIGDRVHIGDNSIVSEGCIIEGDAVLEPNTVVPPLHRIPTKQVWGGNPAKFIKEVEDH